MVNKFIAWDKDRKEFVYDFTIYRGEALIRGGEMVENSSIHQDIGLKDINNKSIYADSSIVEFEYLDKKLESHYVVGHFYFNKTELKYWIKILKCETLKYGNIGFVNARLKSIKIIDTIQENKLGLVK